MRLVLYGRKFSTAAAAEIADLQHAAAQNKPNRLKFPHFMPLSHSGHTQWTKHTFLPGCTLSGASDATFPCASAAIPPKAHAFACDAAASPLTQGKPSLLGGSSAHSC